MSSPADHAHDAADLAHDWASSASAAGRVVPGSFRVWAPRAGRVRLAWRRQPQDLPDGARRYREAPWAAEELAGAGFDVLELAAAAGGWWSLRTDGSASDLESIAVALREGAIDYGYLLDDDPTLLPDPRGRWAPYGPHGPTGLAASTGSASEQPTPEHAVAGAGPVPPVPPRPAGLEDGAPIYELHIGTFTAQGTLDSAIERLDYLRDLGIGWVEPLPVNTFAGVRNWGYDGVEWFAVDESYGGPEAYRRFVNAAHDRGMGVLQDVVFNHLGPSGNYLTAFGPYLHQAASNPWGESLNLDGPESDEVRAYILDVLTMFVRDYDVDGFRLDAVHALVDSRAVTILEDMAILCDRLGDERGRAVTLIAESDRNDPATIAPRRELGAGAGGLGLAGQWSDDFHHAVHVALTGEDIGYYSDFADPEALAKVLESGFYHDGTYSSFRRRVHGRPIDTAAASPEQLVVSIQNHDQVGNRAAGDRLPQLATLKDLGVGAALLLFGPNSPMLFMGEEWAASTPWQFFTDHREEWLGEAVSKGRASEFAAMGWDASRVPDPQNPATFERSKLDWAEAQSGEHAAMLALYRKLIGLRMSRHEYRGARFADVRVFRGVADSGGRDAGVGWQIGAELVVLVNPSRTGVTARFDLPAPVDHVLLDTAAELSGASPVEAGGTAVEVPAGRAVGLTLRR